jgi:hypothetical protein
MNHIVRRAFSTYRPAAQVCENAMYFLSTDCFVCRAQNYWVVLNAARDRYSCVTHADLASIGDRLHGWRNRNENTGHFPRFGAEADKLIESLVANGIITVEPNEGKAFAESECPPCEREMGLPDPDTSVKHHPSGLVHFVVACATIDWHLRKEKLSRTLARVEQHRIRARAGAAIGDVTRISELIAAFKGLRPLYPRPYLCLFDSLALLEFLASYRSFPRIVFGIVADPFQAHCWLQEGNTVLNDDLERVGKYKPILSL